MRLARFGRSPVMWKSARVTFYDKDYRQLGEVTFLTTGGIVDVPEPFPEGTVGGICEPVELEDDSVPFDEIEGYDTSIDWDGDFKTLEG